jgi:nitrite reductase (NADH) small subunit
VFRTGDDQVFALLDRCPHKGGPLSQGIVHGASVTCPLHNWVISLETGKALGADEGAVRTIPIKVENGEIFIALDAATSRAA